MPDHPPKTDVSEHPDWNRALPEVVSEPTPWPATLALASTLLVWGLISSLIITCVGAFLFVVSVVYWTGDIRHERKSQS